MSNPDNRFFVFLAFSILLAMALVLAVALYGSQPPPAGEVNLTQEPANVSQQCFQGQNMSCATEDGCFGYEICREGQWSECIVPRSCIPGSRGACYIDSCKMGYGTCNYCGTAIENCTQG